MYFKGANLLNTIRSIYDNDELWWKTLKDYTETYKHQIIDTETTENFFDEATEVDLQPIFDQYLRHTDLPKLQFRKKEGKTQARWIADVEDFKMPVDIFIDGKEVRITPTDEWGDLKENIALNKIEVNDLEFYIKTSYKK